MGKSLFPLFFMLGACAAPAFAPAETVRCPARRSAEVSALPRDAISENADRIRLTFWKNFGLLDFDLSALKGRKIVKAVLHIAVAGGNLLCVDRGSDLRWFTLSTVSGSWEEASKDREVLLGNGNTLRDDVDGGDPRDGWFAIPFDPRLVKALAAGASSGLMIMDGSGPADREFMSFVAGCGSKKPPYLSVTVEGRDDELPSPPSDVRIIAAPNEATGQSGAAILRWTVPEGAFAYDLRIHGAPAPRRKIPFAGKAGATEDVLVENLPPDSEFLLEVAALNASGKASPSAVVRGRSSPKITVPELPKSEGTPQGGDVPRVWAFPEISKLDPLTGRIILEEGMENAASRNAVWDAGMSTVRVSAARGEIAGFQLALEGAAKGVRIDVTGLDGVGVKIWKTWFVNVGGVWQGEYAVPMGADGISSQVEGQKAAVAAVDLIVPSGTAPGRRAGTIVVSGEGLPETRLRLNLEIYDTVIPDEIRFNPELNCYGGPDQPGSDAFFDYFRLAHYHRCTINPVTHRHTGEIHGTWVDALPLLDADGRVADWSPYDHALGPLLDGSAFRDNPRRGIPVPCLYLPHHENWPLPMRDYYDTGPHVPLEGEHWKPLHDMAGRPPEESFSKIYTGALVENVGDFVKHFEEKGWTQTRFQMFHNNKWYQGNVDRLLGTAWTLDEPRMYLDWRALRFYSALFHEGIRGARKTVFHFRGDISRPMIQGNSMDGLMGEIYVGGTGFDLYPAMVAHKRRMPTRLFRYGSCNPPSRANHETVAWCLSSYVHECDGVLPWQSLGSDAAIDKGDQKGRGNALLVDGRRFGVSAVASYRVHSLRAGAQLAELLRNLERKNGWGRRHSAALVSQVIPLAPYIPSRREEGAEAVPSKGLNGDQWVRLKEGILKLLAR